MAMKRLSRDAALDAQVAPSMPIPEDMPPVPNLSAAAQFAELRNDVLRAYEQGVSLEEAERLAAKFLHAQMNVAEMIRSTDLDARMKKNGYKTIRAKVYLDIVQSSDKKPTETMLDSIITTNALVAAAQDSHEQADVDTEALQRYFDIFRDAHIYYRTLSKQNG